MDDNLHSIKNLEEQIKAAKMLSFLFGKDKRDQINELYEQVTNLASQTDIFNKNFSDSGWCAYDSMNFPLMQSANEAFEKEGLDAGEKVLINYYKNDVKEIMHWLKNKAKPFMERYYLIQKAFEDHFAERYYASVPLFLIIIDGAVNDFTKSKGFFAEGTDLTAWDCLVGCSDGLLKLKEIFNKGRNKTTSEEIKLPYRNGILHGRDLNYGNEYVSCKCVSLMFALADWMNMKSNEENRKAKFEKETNPPPLRESLKKLAKSKIAREKIAEWKARKIIVGENISSCPTIEECNDFQYLIPLLKMFAAWQNNNYGDLSLLLKNMFSYEPSDKKRAGECRKLFQNKKLIEYKLKEIEERGCGLTRVLIEVQWKTNDKIFKELLEFGIVYQGENDSVALPWNGDGCWNIMPWDVRGLYKF